MWKSFARRSAREMKDRELHLGERNEKQLKDRVDEQQ
jgi:hypothetical protein